MFLNCPAGVHGVPQAYLHETGWFIQDFGAAGHGGWLPEPVSFQLVFSGPTARFEKETHTSVSARLFLNLIGACFSKMSPSVNSSSVRVLRSLLFPHPSSQGLVCISSALCGCSGLWFLFSRGVVLYIETSLCVNPGRLGRPLKEHDLPPLYLLSLTVLVSPPFAGRIFLSSSSVPELEAWGSTWQLQTRWGRSPSAHHDY